jgi:hypothetical protein
VTTSTRSALYKAPHDYCSLGTDGQHRINRFGIGYGGRGFYGNTHYGTEAEAVAAFEAELRQTRESYAKGGPVGGCGKWVEEETPADGSLLRSVRFTGLLKSGKRSKLYHVVQLYRIELSPAQEQEIRDYYSRHGCKLAN